MITEKTEMKRSRSSFEDLTVNIRFASYWCVSCIHTFCLVLAWVRRPTSNEEPVFRENEPDTSMFMARDVNFGVRTRGYVYNRCSSRAPKLLVAVYRLSDAYNLQSTRPQ